MKKTDFSKMSFGEIIEKAESLGWKDPDYLTDGEWTHEDADNTEENAINFIINKRNKLEEQLCTIVEKIDILQSWGRQDPSQAKHHYERIAELEKKANALDERIYQMDIER